MPACVGAVPIRPVYSCSHGPSVSRVTRLVSFQGQTDAPKTRPLSGNLWNIHPSGAPLLLHHTNLTTISVLEQAGGTSGFYRAAHTPGVFKQNTRHGGKLKELTTGLECYPYTSQNRIWLSRHKAHSDLPEPEVRGPGARDNTTQDPPTKPLWSCGYTLKVLLGPRWCPYVDVLNVSNGQCSIWVGRRLK